MSVRKHEPTRSLWPPLSLAAILALAAGMAFAQLPPPPAAKPSASSAQAPPPAAPALRITTRLVQVGVVVHDKNGPVANLTKDDFTILDRGKPQPISVFSVTVTGAVAAPAVGPLPQNTFSDLPMYNPAAPGSITIVLLDNLNTLYGSAPGAYEETPLWMEDHALSNAKAHLLEYLKHLDAQDRVAIYGLSDTLHVLCDFTSDRERLLAIVRDYDARSRTSRETVEPAATHTPVPGPEFNGSVDAQRMELAGMVNASRAGTTMAALRAIADHVAHIPGRKNLVWLTANLPFSAKVIAALLSPAQIAAYPVDGRGLLPRSLLADGGTGSVNADVLNHGAGPQSMQTMEPVGISTMREVAELTGGEAFVNNNDLTGAIREAVNDASVLYTLGFYINAASADGKFHELKVTVRPAGLNVRYPKGFLAFRDAPSTRDEVHANWVTALLSPIESSAVPMQVTIERVTSAPNSLRIFAAIDVGVLRLTQNGNVRQGALNVRIFQQDLAGKILSQSADHLALRLAPKQYLAALHSGVHFEKIVESNGSAVTLRIVVQDPVTAMVGSLIIPLREIK